ncbi:probable arginine--tRNA ligase, mitochondrial [Musca vetustissima]|uniref:probable arginine--tRNA ligase, mitochondrial n=1 Tax=Musca vetustissima TaxID=27455 RepID=UPI002AB67AC5|nr:probable arginine--tRNA ligase, mitochondrial [Musca vetustissima]
MSCLIRKTISEKITQVVKNNNVYYELEAPLKRSNGKPVLQWTVKEGSNQQQHTTDEDNSKLVKAVASLNYDNDLVQEIRTIPGNGKLPSRVEFHIHEEPYVKSLLNPSSEIEIPRKRNSHMVFEYSSPNIAKPFHVGHLRSTIIGNVLANLHQNLGYQVTKMNYLGDWGTQFGLLQVGVELLQATDEQIQNAPIETLYKAYVRANKEAIVDATIADKAREYFHQLESGNQSPDVIRQWQKYREYTIQELQTVYQRLGVTFDIYDWESMYSQQHITDVLQALDARNLLLPEKDGRKVVEVDKRRVPIIKSDGSTLYLTRDIAALLDRWQRFNFEQIFYIVENGQTDHFKALFQTTSRLKEDLDISKLKHVKFGRIHGMSTRKGQAVFLKDLLDEARDRMLEKQAQSPTTKVDVDSNEVADILGVSAVIINDLKQRRQRDYEFNWDKALQMNGDTGVKLQYTHCRLYSLMEQNQNINLDNIEITYNHLQDPEALDLLNEISKYPQILWQAKEQLEACILVNYLFGLCNSTSRALKKLPIKSETDVRKQQHRLLLFNTAKDILKQGMMILGLKPLNQM